MRTIKELLQLILKEGNKKFGKGNPNGPMYENGYIGLCGFADDLRLLGILADLEREILMDFIKDNRPKLGSKHCDPDRINSLYYWRPYEWGPRRKWLMYHIKNM